MALLIYWVTRWNLQFRPLLHFLYLDFESLKNSFLNLFFTHCAQMVYFSNSLPRTDTVTQSYLGAAQWSSFGFAALLIPHPDFSGLNQLPVSNERYPLGSYFSRQNMLSKVCIEKQNSKRQLWVSIYLRTCFNLRMLTSSLNVTHLPICSCSVVLWMNHQVFHDGFSAF